MPPLQHLKTVSCCALLFSVIVACNQSGPPGEPTTLKSTDGKFQITVPGGWTAKSPAEGEIIKAANGSGELDVSVDAFSKGAADAGATIDKATDGARNGIINKYGSGDVTQPESLTVNGRDARQFEVKKSNEKCLTTVAESSEHFHLIITCAPASKYDENKAMLKEMSGSFRAL